MSDDFLERGLPQDSDAERALLGVFLQSPQWLAEFPIAVREFFHDRHRRIYNAMVGLQSEGLPVEFPAIYGWLKSRDEIELVGGATYISSLVDGIPVSDPTYYVKQVHSKWLQRECIRTGYEIQSAAFEAEDGADALSHSERLLALVAEAETGSAEATRTAGEGAQSYLEDLERRQTMGTGIRTGLQDLDASLCALDPETLTLVGARPSNGKSALALTWAHNIAKEGRRVGFFSLEMTTEEMSQRLLSMTGRIDLHSLRGQRLAAEDWQRLMLAKSALDTLPIYFDDTRGLTAIEVCARMRRMKRRHGIDAFFVDYLTRLRFARNRELRHELGDAVKAFKDVAGELNTVNIALSQLRRPMPGTAIHKPQLSDLRESGNLEEDADNVLFVHRDEMYQPTDENRGLADVIVAKQRQGPAPEFVKLAFIGNYVKFENLWQRY